MKKLFTKIKFVHISGFLSASIFIIISFLLIKINNSFFFQYDILSKYGDQQIYYSQALDILNYRNNKSPSTIGYSIFYIPFIVFNVIFKIFSADWRSITPLVIFVQSFILVPLTFFLIFKKKEFKTFLFGFLLLFLYYFLIIFTSKEPLIKYLYFGLIPLAEPLAILILIFIYEMYFTKIDKTASNNVNIKNFFIFSICISYLLMVRSTTLLLLLPIALDLLFKKKYKIIILLMLLTLIFFSPQLIYNFWVGESFFWYSYNWWNSLPHHIEKYTKLIESTYYLTSSKIFSFDYLKLNMFKLFYHYCYLIFLLILLVFQRKIFSIYIFVSSLINLFFYLSYFWSPISDTIDRLLLPNYIVVIYFIVYNFNSKNLKKIKI
jgi:hypothetical protein